MSDGVQSGRAVYLNNATTGFPRSEQALLAFAEALARPPADVRHSDPGSADVELARQRVARSLGVEAHQLFFTPDATTGLNLVLQGFLRPGDHCLLDNRPHNALTRTLAGMGHAAWSIAPLYAADDGCRPERLLELIGPRTTLVCLDHASNVNGSLYPLDELVPLLRQRAPGVALLVDSCQAVGASGLDAAIGADFLVFSGHKLLHALPGAAVLVARRRLRPLLFGGTGTHSASLTLPDLGLHHVEVGTPNGPAILALAAALEDAQQRLAGYRRLLDAATGRLWDGLQAVDGLRSLGRPPGAGTRTGVIACRTLVGSPEADWMPWLRRMGIIARGGLHCAPVQHEQLGLLPAGTLRFSVSRFTSATEIDVALVALAEISARLQREGASAAGRPAVDADAPAPLPAPLPAAAAPPRSELLAFQPGPGGVELIVRQVVPCAEGEGEELLQLEGSWRGAELETLAAALAALGWQVTRLPSRLMLTASWQGARLILAANGEYSLSRIRDREAALAMLTAVARRCSALPAGQARGDAG